MTRFFLLIGFAVILAACNSSDSHGTGNRTHSGHSVSADSAGNGDSGQLAALHNAMVQMNRQMETMTLTGDADHDFAMLMMHHHKAAIDMARAELAGGSDETLKQMARNILNDQQKEIDQFNEFLQDHPHGNKSDYGEKAKGMMSKMDSMQMHSSSVDATFARMMIPHHQDAIIMSEQYIKVGKSKELVSIAKNIVAMQQKEIKELENWLNKNQK